MFELWRVHRDAVIAQDGVIVDRKPHLDAEALRAITRALAAAPVAAELVATPAEPLSVPVPTAAVPVSAPPAHCAARGCIGAVGPGPTSPELADFCVGHRGVVIRAARRLGTPHPDAARALRLHGQVTRATVNLSRAA